MAWRRQIRFDQTPFRVGKIASIAKLCAAMIYAGGRVPHDGFQGWCRNPSESYQNSIVHHYAAVLTQPLRDESSTQERPEGVINDISADLSALIPSVSKVTVIDNDKDYSFGVTTSEGLNFSSRVISDGTLRLLALLTILDDPNRRGILCFEEPENGVHEGRISALVELLREAAQLNDYADDPLFQVLINTHSPAVLNSLNDPEIVAADTVTVIDPKTKTRHNRTRMRVGVTSDNLDLDPVRFLTRAEVNHLLRKTSGQA